MSLNDSFSVRDGNTTACESANVAAPPTGRIDAGDGSVAWAGFSAGKEAWAVGLACMLAGSKQRPQASKADTTGVKASRGVNSIWVGRGKRALAKQKEARQQSKQSDPFITDLPHSQGSPCFFIVFRNCGYGNFVTHESQNRHPTSLQ